VGNFTKVFNDSGSEISNITEINLNISPDKIVTATVEVSVDSSSELDNIHALLGTETLKQIADLHGYELVKKHD
jgi:hypothetical protein